MARIADAELERLKREVSLVRLIEGQGHRLVSQGKVYDEKSDGMYPSCRARHDGYYPACAIMPSWARQRCPPRGCRPYLPVVNAA